MLLHHRVFVTSMAVAAGLSFAAAGHAQTASQAAPPAAPAAEAQVQAPAGVNLTQAQRDQIRALREAQRKEAQALREKLRTARQQLRHAMAADVPDEAAVRSAAEAVAALQADQAVLQSRSRAQVTKLLTPDQQARLKDARARAAERAMRAERQMLRQRSQMMRREQMRRDQMLRRQYWRWWRDWI